jgi:hypothetical protein
MIVHDVAREALHSAAPRRGAAASCAGCGGTAALAQRANAGPHARSLAATAQRAAARPGGLPEGLRAGLEQLSGRDLSGVRVHYRSPKPAQLQAHAYAQGRDIHLAPGQEHHLPHEGWHAVQQMENRVRPTMQLHGTGINDDARLEAEASRMGARAARIGAVQRMADTGAAPGGAAGGGGGVVQRAVGFEFQTSWNIVPDPFGPVEGTIGQMGKTVSQVLGGDEEGSSTLGFLTGRLARGVVDTGSWMLGGLGRMAMSGLRGVGGGGIADTLEGGVGSVRRVTPLVIPKGFTLVSGLGWTMSSDEGEMEFATTHVGEDDVQTMRVIMRDLSAFAARLKALRRMRQIPLVWFPDATLLGSVAAVVPGDAAMPAVPQMTAGVDLGRVAELMRVMSRTGSEERRQLTREKGPTIARVYDALPGELDDFSPRYRGIVALMALHVAQSSLLPAVSTEKDITPLMARTSLGVAFRETPESQGAEDRAALKEQLLGHVLATAGEANSTMENFTTVPVGEGMKLFPSKTGMDDPFDNGARTGPTVRAWVEGVVDGRDLTAATGLFDRISARSMGAWSHTEEVGPEGAPGLIMEFRDLPRDIPEAEWMQWAMTWMDLIATVNAMED